MRTRRFLCAAALLTAACAPLAPAATLPVTSDLILWLDATDIDGDGVVEGNSEAGLSFSGGQYYVQTWVDKSASGNNATNLPGLAPVTDLGAGPGGSNAVEFGLGGAGDRMQVTGFTYGGDMTYFAVFNADTTTTGQVFNTNGATAVDNAGAYVLEFAAGSNHQGRVYDNPANSGVVTGSVSSSTNYLSTYVFESNTAGGAELKLDGASQGTANTNNISSTTSTAYVGNHPSASVGYDGHLSALVVYDRKLTAAEENAVGYALERQFGLSTAYDPTSIAINFYRSADPTFTQIGATQFAGVDPADNWNNVDVDDDATNTPDDIAFGPQALVDNNGDATSVTVRSTVNQGYAEINNSIGNSTPDHTLLNAALFMDTTNNDTGAIIIEGLDTFSSFFDVYVYIDSGSGNNRDFAVTLNGVTLTGQDRGGFDGTLTPGDGVNDGVDDDYLLFSGLSGPTLTLTATNPLNNGRVGIAGIQILAIPAPAALPAGLGLIGLAAARRRRRR